MAAKVNWVVKINGFQYPAPSESAAKGQVQVSGDEDAIYGTIIRGSFTRIGTYAQAVKPPRDYRAEWARRQELGTAFNGHYYERLNKQLQRELQSV